MPHEIFDRVEAYKLRSKKIEYLASKGDYVIKTILQGAFNERIKLDLPEGSPPFNADKGPVGYSTGALKTKIMKFKYLLPSVNLPRAKKERMFIEILESVSPKDAEVLIAMKDKKLSEMYTSITVDIVKEAFPKLPL